MVSLTVSIDTNIRRQQGGTNIYDPNRTEKFLQPLSLVASPTILVCQGLGFGYTYEGDIDQFFARVNFSEKVKSAWVSGNVQNDIGVEQ
jgi:hypothetical protein